MKKYILFIGYIIGILVLLVIVMKVFFPVYHVKSISETRERGSDYSYYIVVSRFYYSFFDKKTNDIILFKPITINNRDLGGLTDSGVWIFNVGVVGNNVTLFSKKTDEIEKKLSEGYEPKFIDGFDDRSGIVSNEKIIGKVIFSFECCN